MKRSDMMVIVKVCGEAVLITIAAGIAVGVIGYINKWDTSTAYSNAFFIAGCLVFLAGAASRLAAGQEWSIFQRFSGESFRDMSSGEQASFVVKVSSSLRFVIVGVLSGLLLILISGLLLKAF